MLLSASDSTLLIVDMQGRLMPVIHDGESVLNAAHKLAQAARLLDVPVAATEHHARMLGATVEPLRAQVQSTFQKMHFSSALEPGFDGWLPAARKTILVAGCEAHICVLQTVIGLIDLATTQCWWPMPRVRASRRIITRHCAARGPTARKSSPPRWRFSSGCGLASIRVSARCYVWSNSAGRLQHCAGEAQRFSRPLTQFMGKPHSQGNDILRS